MVMTAEQFCLREVRLRNAHGADDKAAGARGNRITSWMVPCQILKASRPVVTDNYFTLRSTSL